MALVLLFLESSLDFICFFDDLQNVLFWSTCCLYKLIFQQFCCWASFLRFLQNNCKSEKNGNSTCLDKTALYEIIEDFRHICRVLECRRAILRDRVNSACNLHIWIRRLAIYHFNALKVKLTIFLDKRLSTVIPSDHISAKQSYPISCITSGAIQYYENALLNI